MSLFTVLIQCIYTSLPENKWFKTTTKILNIRHIQYHFQITELKPDETDENFHNFVFAVIFFLLYSEMHVKSMICAPVNKDLYCLVFS